MHTTCSHTLSGFYEQMFVVLMKHIEQLISVGWGFLMFPMWSVYLSLRLVYIFPTSEGCDPGTYLATNDTCLPCPANSNSTQSGAFVCPCFEGYYRAAGEPPEMECTRKSFVFVLS